MAIITKVVNGKTYQLDSSKSGLSGYDPSDLTQYTKVSTKKEPSKGDSYTGSGGYSGGSRTGATSNPTTTDKPVEYPHYYDSYEDFLSKSGYNNMLDQQRAAVDAYLEQAKNNYGQQETAVNQAADDAARQAYIAYMQSNQTLPQQLSASGFSGGMADSQRLGLETNWQNNRNKVEQQRENELNMLRNQINNALLQGEIEAANQAAQLYQQAQNNWNDYVTRSNEFANTDYWSQKNMDYNDYWAQQNQEFQNYWNQQQMSLEERLNQAKLDFEREQSQYSQNYQSGQADQNTAQQARENAYTTAMALLKMGVMPNSELLATAGITELEAQSYADTVNRQLGGSGSKSGGSSGGGGSGGGGSGGGNAAGADGLVQRFNGGDYSDDVINGLLAAGYTMDDLVGAGYTQGSGGTTGNSSQAQSYVNDLMVNVGSNKTALRNQINSDLAAGYITREVAQAALQLIGA